MRIGWIGAAVVAAAIAVVSVWWVVGHRVSSKPVVVTGRMTDQHEPVRPPGGIGQFVAYRPSRFDPGVAFQYPNNWLVNEIRGHAERYDQIILLGPRNQSDTLNATVTIWVAPDRGAGGYYESFDRLYSTRLQALQKGAVGAVRADDSVSLAGHPARGLEVEMTLPPHYPAASTPSPTPAKRRVILAQIGNRLIELSYLADASEYDRYHPVFLEAVSSLTVQ